MKKSRHTYGKFLFFHEIKIKKKSSGGEVIYFLIPQQSDVAQRLAQSPDTREADGSNPSFGTKMFIEY